MSKGRTLLVAFWIPLACLVLILLGVSIGERRLPAEEFPPPPVLGEESPPEGVENWRKWLRSDGEPRYRDISHIGEGEDEAIIEVAELLVVLYDRWQRTQNRTDLERVFLALKAALVCPMSLSDPTVSEALLQAVEEMEWSTDTGVRLRAQQLQMEYDFAKSKYDRGR